MRIPINLFFIIFFTSFYTKYFVQCQQNPCKAGKGSLVVFVKHRDPSVGMRITVAADKMTSFVVSDKLYDTCNEHWMKKVEAKQMTQNRMDSLLTFLGSEWKYSENKKLHYHQNPNDPNWHFVLGFTGDADVIDRFAGTSKEGIQNMQDLAKLVDTEYRDYYRALKEPLPGTGHTYLTTEGKEVHALRVGGMNAPYAEQLKGNIHAIGFGPQKMMQYLQKNLHVNQEGVIEVGLRELEEHLQEGFRRVSRHALEHNGRPLNSVSASWHGIDLGPAEENHLPQKGVRYFDHHNQEEAERIARIQHDHQYTAERAVRDLVRTGQWNEHFKREHPEYKDVWEDEERRKAEIREKLLARSKERHKAEIRRRLLERSGQGTSSEPQPSTSSNTGRNLRPPPTPRRVNPNIRKKKMSPQSWHAKQIQNRERGRGFNKKKRIGIRRGNRRG